MKVLNKNLLMAAVALTGVLFSSCDENDPDDSITVDLAYTEIEYNESGEWKDCMNPDAGDLFFQNVSFSHHAEVSPYGAMWSGFCPSRSDDMADYSAGNWMDHQWSCMAGGGVSGLKTPYLIAYWNTVEDEVSEDGSLVIKYGDGTSSFTARSVYVNNTTYGYFAMKNGTAFSKTFAAGDWCKTLFYGVTASGTVSDPVEAYLVDFRSEDESEWSMLKDWTMVNLESLNSAGPIKYICIRMESSDSGKWGMNSPSYFALDRLTIEKE